MIKCIRLIIYKCIAIIKEKVLAAKRSGLKEIIMCCQNEKDVLEINPLFIKGTKFHYVKTMQQVIDIALT